MSGVYSNLVVKNAGFPVSTPILWSRQHGQSLYSSWVAKERSHVGGYSVALVNQFGLAHELLSNQVYFPMSRGISLKKDFMIIIMSNDL